MSTQSTPSEFRVQKKFIKSPDTKARDEALTKLRAEIKQKDDQLTEINAQLKKTTTDPQVSEERKTLIAELGELKKTQADLKNKRNIVNAKIKEVDSALKRKITEISGITSKYSYKSVDDIDKKIARSEDEISTGALSLVEERRLVKEISSLRKLRKDFASLEAVQKLIDDDKAKIADLKKQLTSFNSRETSEKFDATQKKLNELTLSNKTVTDKRSTLNTKRNALHKEKDVLYAQMTKIRSEFDEQYKTFQQALKDEQKRVVEEEKKLRAAKEKSERKTKVDNELAEASRPAFEYEIDTIHTLLTYFDPSYVKPTKTVEFNKPVFTNERKGRVVESVDDFEIIKKEEVQFFAGSNNQSSKKNKAQKNKKFTLEPDVISQLGDLEIALPTSKDAVPATIESLKAKLQHYTESQEETTKKNVEAAKAKIAKLEAKWAKEDAAEAEAQAEAQVEAQVEAEESKDEE